MTQSIISIDYKSLVVLWWIVLSPDRKKVLGSPLIQAAEGPFSVDGVVWLLSGNSDILPQSKDMHDPKLLM